MQFEYGKKLLTDRYTPFDIDKENLIGSLGEESSHTTRRVRNAAMQQPLSYQLSVLRLRVDRNPSRPSRPPRY